MLDLDTRIAVAGAGSIGCYVGGCLALAGRDVAFLARPANERSLRAHGLRVTDLEGRDRMLEGADLSVSADPATAFHDAGLILVTVKSGASEEMARLIAAYAPKGAVVLSLQNGIDNAERIRAVARRPVQSGMVPFNVVRTQAGNDAPLHLHRATEGAVLVEEGVEGLADLLSVEGCAVAARADMKAVLWGKLLFNLNNALVALSGLPLAKELRDRRWRLILADQIAEALAAMNRAGIRPAAAAGTLKPDWLPAALRLPDWLFGLLARRMLAIDPAARSSMWDDLERRRPTEIDALQGAVLRLAVQVGTDAPRTAGVVRLVREAEQARRGSPGLTPGVFR
jgi:2-dehydropantoate 2-reductase